MAAGVLVDTGFLVALLSRRDANHVWAAARARRRPPPWHTCEAALSETFHLLGESGSAALGALLRRKALIASFSFAEHLEGVLSLVDKYADVPASLADACLVRMTEIHDEVVLLTTDADFRIYRRHGRQVVPVEMPASSPRRGER